MATTTRGVPYPTPGAVPDFANDMFALAEWLDAHPGVSPLTTTQRNALTGAELWDGRLILNMTTGLLEQYDDDTDTWKGTTTLASLGTGTPEAGTLLHGDGTWGPVTSDDFDDPISADILLPSLLLATKTHNPGSLATYSTTSATPVDVDATNLAITFAAPPSGAVIVRLNAFAGGGAGNNAVVSWALRDGGGTLAGTTARIAHGTDLRLRCSLAVRVTGLTPGTSYTWKWAHAAFSGTDVTFMYVGDTIGPALMEVWAA